MSGGATIGNTIDSITRGIGDSDNPTGADLLADVNPTYNGVRLAQRVTARIRIDTAHLPAGVVRAAGMIATLIVKPRDGRAPEPMHWRPCVTAFRTVTYTPGSAVAGGHAPKVTRA